MRYKIVIILILFLFVIVGCNNKPLETMWYRDTNFNFHEINNPKTIKKIKNLVNDIPWKGTESGHVSGEPDFSFWIGRNKDNVRIIHCNVWRLDSQHLAITKMGAEFDILNRYSEITQTQFNQITRNLGINANDI
jgi:hypothetical protein